MQRKDAKGRNLLTGENQLKDGKYMYKWNDLNGNPKYVYSWKLVASDPLPAGKRACKPLREMEKEIQRDLQDGIDTNGGKMTVCQLYQRYIDTRPNVATNTAKSREWFMGVLKADELGAKQIGKVKPSDIRVWGINMTNHGYSYETIRNTLRSLSACFQLAVQDDLIRKNPVSVKIDEVKRNDKKEKIALTEMEQEKFLSFVKSDPVAGCHYNAFLILLKTGLRISELLGLTIHDVDLERQQLSINHQLLYDCQLPERFYIQRPKTQMGNRILPLSPIACQAFQSAIENRKPTPEVGGLTDFIFVSSRGKLLREQDFNRICDTVVKKYNKSHKDKLPKITPHILRHTFCSRLIAENLDPKTVQYLMGHKSVTTTLAHYTHVSFDDVSKKIKNAVA